MADGISRMVSSSMASAIASTQDPAKTMNVMRIPARIIAVYSGFSTAERSNACMQRSDARLIGAHRLQAAGHLQRRHDLDVAHVHRNRGGERKRDGIRDVRRLR